MMIQHSVRVYPSNEPLPKERQLAWKLAELASRRVPLLQSVQEMVMNRVIDSAGVALAAINRQPVANARSQALCHPRDKGTTLFGVNPDYKVDAEWAAWANGTALRELDMHDTFLAADYSHPADSIPPLLAVAQQCQCNGEDLLYAIVTAYEVQINLVKGICLHKHKIDHIAHLGPAVAAGLGTLLHLDIDTIYQAIQQVVHVSMTTRQSRKGEISSWKAYAPAHAGKLAIEAVDRAMRGENSPSPIYEGQESVIASLLDGSDSEYVVPLPDMDEPRQAILQSYTKEHSAEYQAQAIIDLAFRMRSHISDFQDIESITIHTSHHTHCVIGTGSSDPQKFDPGASRETLDHSIMYIFAVALQDGIWHHIDSYRPERASRPDTVELWQKISTTEDLHWTGRYHEPEPDKRAFGGRVEIQLTKGRKLFDELGVANAHPMGEKPFAREHYISKFNMLTAGVLSQTQQKMFLALAENLSNLSGEELNRLNPSIDSENLICGQRDSRGIF